MGNAIAFAALTCCTAYLQIKGHDVDGIWFIVVLWAICGDFK